MIIDKMDYIFAIAKEQNLTRAAKRLFVAQSTLTMYLNRVESELGIKLFDRSNTSGGTVHRGIEKDPADRNKTVRQAPADGPSGGDTECGDRPDAQCRLDAAAAASFP